jgi:hypothetical protein
MSLRKGKGLCVRSAGIILAIRALIFSYAAVIQMEEYLRRQRAGEEIPMVTGWLEKHKVVKRLLQGGVGDIEMEE